MHAHGVAQVRKAALLPDAQVKKTLACLTRARQEVVGLGANDGAFAVFQRHWQELDGIGTA